MVEVNVWTDIADRLPCIAFAEIEPSTTPVQVYTVLSKELGWSKTCQVLATASSDVALPQNDSPADINL